MVTTSDLIPKEAALMQRLGQGIMHAAMGSQHGQAWLEQAKCDLAAAQASGEVGHYEWACFQAQQAVEKALKGYLLTAGRSYQRIHAVSDWWFTSPLF